MTSDLAKRLRSAATDAVRSVPDDDLVEALAAVAREAAGLIERMQAQREGGGDPNEAARKAADEYLDTKLRAAAQRAVAAYEDTRRPGGDRWSRLDAGSRLATAMAELERAIGG